MNAPDPSCLPTHLGYLKLTHVAENYDALAQQAAAKRWTHVEYLERLLDGEYQLRQHRAAERRIQAARFCAVKTLDSYEWDWPKKINEAQVRNIFRLGFVTQKSNVIFMGRCGTGKSHLALALGYHACQHGHTVLYTSAIDALNRLVAAKAAHRLRTEFRRYLAPSILVCDELGYLPLDKVGADLVFQLISQRYEQGSLVLTTNLEYKRWSEIFNNDSGLTSAILDRVLHRADTVVIEGKSYRMKGHAEAAA